MQTTQTYAHYVAVVSARGVTPVTEVQFNALQTLPRVADVNMPRTLNYAIGVALEAGDNTGAASLIRQGDEYTQECWQMFTEEGDHLPAEGLHANIEQWAKFGRDEVRPLNIAYMLDFDGNSPKDQTCFSIGKQNFFFNGDSICQWDNEREWDFLCFHFLSNPTLKQILVITIGCFDVESLADMLAGDEVKQDG
jgi:hypothetical protein